MAEQTFEEREIELIRRSFERDPISKFETRQLLKYIDALRSRAEAAEAERENIRIAANDLTDRLAAAEKKLEAVRKVAENENVEDGLGEILDILNADQPSTDTGETK